MDYEKAYKEALERARQFSEYPLQEDSSNIVEYIFPELRESEDEKVRKHIIEIIKNHFSGEDADKCIAWLEKQVPIDEEKVLIGARKDVALSIMNFLDRNTLGMDLSSMERADLESAVIDSDWSKVYDYMKKKLEKQGEQNPFDYENATIIPKDFAPKVGQKPI